MDLRLRLFSNQRRLKKRISTGGKQHLKLEKVQGNHDYATNLKWQIVSEFMYKWWSITYNLSLYNCDKNYVPGRDVKIKG